MTEKVKLKASVVLSDAWTVPQIGTTKQHKKLVQLLQEREYTSIRQALERWPYYQVCAARGDLDPDNLAPVIAHAMFNWIRQTNSQKLLTGKWPHPKV